MHRKRKKNAKRPQGKRKRQSKKKKGHKKQRMSIKILFRTNCPEKKQQNTGETELTAALQRCLLKITKKQKLGEIDADDLDVAMMEISTKTDVVTHHVPSGNFTVDSSELSSTLQGILDDFEKMIGFGLDRLLPPQLVAWVDDTDERKQKIGTLAISVKQKEASLWESLIGRKKFVVSFFVFQGFFGSKENITKQLLDMLGEDAE